MDKQLQNHVMTDEDKKIYRYGYVLYHVAICDDDKVFISYIKKILNQAKGKNQYHIEKIIGNETYLNDGECLSVSR